MDIKKILEDRFNAELEDFYDRRIIFWQDPEKEFSDFVDELSLDNAKILRLTESNNFAAKKLLLNDDTQSNYLVYNPISYSDIRDNWLLDIELYSEEFRADLLSIRMQELNMSATAPLRKAMKTYTKFFENKDRVAKLMAFKSDYNTVGQLHIDILAVLSGTSINTASGVIRTVLMSGLDIENNEAIANIKRFGSEDAFWELVNRYTGYSRDESASLVPLASHILLTALSVTMKPSCLRGLDKYISEPHRQLCYSLVNEWIHSEDDDKLYEIARVVEERHNLEKLFDSLELSDLMNSECFPCINECILRRYMSEISDSIIKAENIMSAVEKRRTLKWYKRVRYYFDDLLQVALMQQFYQNNSESFYIAEYSTFWKEYTGKFYKMDYYYRQFHTSFGKSLKESTTVLEDLYKNVADYVENFYKNWFLSSLEKQWMSLIKEPLSKCSELVGIPQQSNFYRDRVKPIASSGSRVYVIISDALRYEVAAELADKLIKETKGTAKISAVQSVFPSATKFGMAALLPHKELQLTDDMKVLCDGERTDSTADREKILKAESPGNVALMYNSFLKMKQAERRSKVSGAETVYIYHNAIDAAGDKQITEDQVFESCEQTVSEIKNLVRLIVNDLSGSNILITADHGFIYSYKPLNEYDKLDKLSVSGNILEFDRRYIIADSECSADQMLSVSMSSLESETVGLTPFENIRIKKSGGGQNYVHGGVSLQECVVPVIEFKNMRSTSKNFVDVKKAELQLISQSRKVSNSIFSLDFYQTQAVGGKIAPNTYEIFMADSMGKPVSDSKMIIADKTSGNGSERLFRTRFTLKSFEFKKTDTYYLTVVEKDSGNVAEKIEFTIDIAFVNDFDF